MALNDPPQNIKVPKKTSAEEEKIHYTKFDRTKRFSYPSSPNFAPLSESPSTPTDPQLSLYESFVQFYSAELNIQVPAILPEKLDLQRERIQNFLYIPYEIERFMIFGYLLCLDSFLSVFTVIPLRFFYCLLNWKRGQINAIKSNLIKGGLLVVGVYLISLLDASRLYHSIRGQSVIKLYVIFNVLEIADRLCCSFGQDILESLFLRFTLNSTELEKFKDMSLFKHFLVATVYLIVHSLVLFYQVAINSHNNALLTLLVSNQFVEIKGSVFKKFEKDNLFQLSCSDIIERFQLSIFLFLITLRNLIEFGAEWPLFQWKLLGWMEEIAFLFEYRELNKILDLIGSLPWFFLQFISYNLPNTLYDILIQPFSYGLDFGSYKTLFDVLLYPVIVIFCSEIIVDWLKHAFITKFNYIKPTMYGHYLLVLVRDYVREGDCISESVTRRIGFASYPLACVVLRITIQTITMMDWFQCDDEGTDFTCILKLVFFIFTIWIFLIFAKWLLNCFIKSLALKILHANERFEDLDDNDHLVTRPKKNNKLNSGQHPPKFPHYQTAPDSPYRTLLKPYITQVSDGSISGSSINLDKFNEDVVWDDLKKQYSAGSTVKEVIDEDKRCIMSTTGISSSPIKKFEL